MVAHMQVQSIWDGPPITVRRGDIWQLGQHKIMCGNACNGAEVDRLLGDVQPDLIFADPPYGIGIDAWDKAIEDIPLFLEIVARHLKQGGFFAFTQQMPQMLVWLNALEDTPLAYKDHIVWVKRVHTSPALPLTRAHESLFIYAHGKATYHQTKGPYSDVKVPGLQFDLITIEGIQTYISDLHLKIKGTGKPRIDNGHKHSSYAYLVKPGDRSPEYTNFSNVWSFLAENHSRMGSNHAHATVKPVKLLGRLLMLCTPECATVYDAFLGSGTTLLAAERQKRTCYGMELSPMACEDIIRRWQKLTCQQAIRLEGER